METPLISVIDHVYSMFREKFPDNTVEPIVTHFSNGTILIRRVKFTDTATGLIYTIQASCTHQEMRPDILASVPLRAIENCDAIMNSTRTTSLTTRDDAFFTIDISDHKEDYYNPYNIVLLRHTLDRWAVFKEPMTQLNVMKAIKLVMKAIHETRAGRVLSREVFSSLREHADEDYEVEYYDDSDENKCYEDDNGDEDYEDDVEDEGERPFP